MCDFFFLFNHSSLFLFQCTQPVLNDLMPDIAMGVSTLSLKDRRLPELAADTELCQPVSEAGPGPPQHLSCIPQRHTHTSRKKHPLEQKADGRENQQEYPDLYDFSNAACRPSTPAPGRRTPSPSHGRYFGPDLYSHNKASPNGLKSAYLPGQTSPKKQEDARREYPLSPDGPLHKQKSEPIRLDVVEQPPQRSDFPSAASENVGNGAAHVRARTTVETDLTFGLTPNRPPSHSACSSEALEERSSRRLTDSESLSHGAQRNTDLERDDSISRGRRSPSKPDFLYKKSALWKQLRVCAWDVKHPVLWCNPTTYWPVYRCQLSLTFYSSFYVYICLLYMACWGLLWMLHPSLLCVTVVWEAS